MKLTVPVLFVALLMSLPALQHGLVDETLSLQSMLVRLGVAIVLAMIGRAVLAGVVDAYRLQNMVRRNRRERSSDVPDGDGPPTA